MGRRRRRRELERRRCELEGKLLRCEVVMGSATVERERERAKVGGRGQLRFLDLEGREKVTLET